MYQGKGIEKTLWTLVFIAMIGFFMVGCNQEEDLASEGENDNEEEVVMEGEAEKEDEEEKEPKDDDNEQKEKSDEKQGDTATKNDVIEVTSDELKKLEAEPYEIKERWILSGDERYILTEIPTAPGSVHQISNFEAWKRAYDDKAQSMKEPEKKLGVVVPLLGEAMLDPGDNTSTRLENHPVNPDLFISSINYKEISPDGKHILYIPSMYEEEGQHEGTESTTGVFVTNFGVPVEPKELNISDGFFSIAPLWSEGSEVIYYILDEGLFSYAMDEGTEKLIIPSKDLPGIPREEKDGRGQGVLYETYREEESTYIYYSHDEKIMKITLGDEAEVEIFYEGLEGKALEKITILQEDLLFLSHESGIFGNTEILLFNGGETEIEKTHGTSQFQDHFISESGHIFLLFTTQEDGAEVQVFDRDLNKEKSYRLPPSFSHNTVLGKVPGKPGELAVIGDEMYYLLPREE